MSRSSLGLAFVIRMVLSYSFTYGALMAYSSSVSMPISVQVSGKLIITDEANEGVGSTESSKIIRNISTDRSKSNFNIINEYNLRIRSNETKWKLIGNLTELQIDKRKRINPRFIKVSYQTSNGHKANPNAGKLVAPFTAPITLSNIPKNLDFIILEGNSKTSSDRDKGNHNNWFGLNFKAEFVGKRGIVNIDNPIYKKKKYNAVVSYTLVSL